MDEPQKNQNESPETWYRRKLSDLLANAQTTLDHGKSAVTKLDKISPEPWRKLPVRDERYDAEGWKNVPQHEEAASPGNGAKDDQTDNLAKKLDQLVLASEKNQKRLEGAMVKLAQMISAPTAKAGIPEGRAIGGDEEKSHQSQHVQQGPPDTWFRGGKAKARADAFNSIGVPIVGQWQNTFDKWDRYWNHDKHRQTGDGPNQEKYSPKEEKSDEVLDAIKELQEDVGEIKDLLGDQQKEPGISKEGKFKPGGKQPIGSSGAATAKGKATLDNPWQRMIDSMRRG